MFRFLLHFLKQSDSENITGLPLEKPEVWIKFMRYFLIYSNPQPASNKEISGIYHLSYISDHVYQLCLDH
jgi:hypothetical protein